MNIFYHTLGSPDSTAPNTWYYGIRCANCNQPMAQAMNPDGAEGKIQFPHHVIPIKCGHCHHEEKYDAYWAAPFLTPPG
jgi:hypothetical protein